jgi:hypothetical protein
MPNNAAHFDEIHHRGQISTYLRPINLRLLGRLSASIKTLQGGTDAHRYLSEPCCSFVPDAL